MVCSFFYFRSEMRNFWFFQQARCEVIVKYTNCNLLELDWIRTGRRTLKAQIDEKNRNIEARQNVTGCYKKQRVYGKKYSKSKNEIMLIEILILRKKFLYYSFFL